MRLREAEFVKKFKRRTAVTEYVVNADFGYLNRIFLAEHFAYRTAQSADYVVFFNCNNSACFLCSLYNDFTVNRLDCVNVDKAGVFSLCFKLFNGFECFVYNKTCCNNRNVVALVKRNALAKLKFVC